MGWDERREFVVRGRKGVAMGTFLGGAPGCHRRRHCCLRDSCKGKRLGGCSFHGYDKTGLRLW